MIKKSCLFFVFLITILSCSDLALAVSEMDILMEEKKNEHKTEKNENINDLSFTDIITGKQETKKEEKKEEKIDADANANESWLKNLFKKGKKDFLEKYL